MKTFILISLIQFTLQIDYCLQEKSVCKKCKSGYYLYNGICSIVEHCKINSLDGNTCFTCQNWYRPNDPNYTPFSSCIKIESDHCYAYSEGETPICEESQPGYKKKEDNTCELVVEHCQRRYLDGDDNLKCGYCQKGYAFNDKYMRSLPTLRRSEF